MKACVKILIADDEAPARNRLHELLAELADVSVIAEAKNGQEAVDLCQRQQPDIAILDISMPGHSGIDAAQAMQQMLRPPAIIFSTAFDRYAMQAFDIQAADYLLKPIRLERLQAAIEKALALRPKNESAAPPKPQRKHLTISERGSIVLVPIEEVIYLRAERKYTTVRTAQKEYVLEESLNNLEQEFDGLFLRLHRNCLVAKAAILGYEKRPVYPVADNNPASANDKQWVAILKNIPDTVQVSRRQQHLIRAS
jgi:two-component system response regulator AlgR